MKWRPERLTECWGEFRALDFEKRLALCIQGLIFFAASAAVIFTCRQVRISNRMLEGTTRAWVLLVKPNVWWKAGETTEGKYSIKNWGNGPATDVRSKAWLVWPLNPPSSPDEPPPPPKELDEPMTGSVFIMGPGQSIGDDEGTFLIKGGVPQDVIDDIKARRRTMFLFGIIRYADGFSRDRETRFCLWHDPDKLKFAYCPRGNTAR